MKNQKHFSLLSGLLAVSDLLNPLLAQTLSSPLTVEKNFGFQIWKINVETLFGNSQDLTEIENKLQ